MKITKIDDGTVIYDSGENTENLVLSANGISIYRAKPKQSVLMPSQPVTRKTTTSTTRADGAGVGGNGYEVQMPKLEINAFGAGGKTPNVAGTVKRIGNVMAAAGTGTAAGFVETAGQLTQPQGLTIGESGRVALQGGTRAQEQAAEQAKAQRIRENIKNPLYATADKLAQQSEEYTEKAKEGLGKVGQFAVDLGVTGAQMLGDMALGLINPVLGTGAMATRVFGGSAQEARQAGATETQQQLYGLGSAATSVLVEKIANVGKAFKTAYGGSIAGGKVDDILTKLTGKLIKNPVGQRILASAAGEAGEEALEALLQPALQAIYDKGETLNKTWFGSTEELTDYLTEVGYNALLGGALGALGGGGNVTAPATTETAQNGAEAAQEAQRGAEVGRESTAPPKGAERLQNGAQRPTWGAYMEDGDIFGGGRKTRAGFTSMENAIANQFERETGISIDSVESILDGLANGDYNSANWVARIAQDAKDPKMVVVAHELTHHLQTLAPQEYEGFRTVVADYFTRAGGETALTDMMNRYRSAYGAAGQNLSDSAVMDEMAADFTEVLLTDADLFGRFARENRTAAERLLDALRAFIEKIRATFTGRARDAAAQEATGKTLSELEMIAEQWQSVYNAAAAAYGQNANTATQAGDGVRYSITEQFTDKDGNTYDSAVLLDTDIFDGVSPKNWGSVLKEHLKNRIADSPLIMPVVDENGNTQNLEFAKPEERASKNGGNSHPVLGELYSTKDNISKLATIHVDEVVEVSSEDSPYHTAPDGHGWLDENGWLHRTAYVINSKNGNIHQITMDIAKARDGRVILYALNGKTKKVGNAEVNSLKIRGSSQNPNSEISVPNLADGVKGNLSQLKSTAPLRQMMAEMPQQMMIRMPRLTTVEQDEAEAAMNAAKAAPVAVEDTVQLPQLGLTDADVPGNEPLTRQDIAREMAWRQRMANEPAAPQAMGEVKLPELSEDVDEAGMGVADFTGNVETVPQEATAEILSALEDLSRDMEAPMETPTDATVRDAESLISAETVEAPQSLKEKAAESWAFFKRKMVDSGEAVTQIGKAINDKYLYPFYNMARASASAGANMIAQEQTDVNGRTVGESLNAIFDPIRAKGKDYYVNFQTYMYDLHNIARMSMDKNAQKERDAAEAAKAEFLAEHPKFINMTREQARRKADSIDELEAEEAKEYLRLERWQNRAASMGNKPVFDYEFSAEMSRGRSERLLREHPEFAQYREQVRKYIDNLMQYRVDSGLMTQKNADFLREYYPDYVPTDRHQAFEDFGPEIREKRVRIAKTVKRLFTGGNKKLVPLHESLGKQTMQVVREGSKNRFGARLLADYTANASDAGIAKYIRDAKETEADFDINSFDEEKKTKENTFSVYFDGKLYEMEVNDALLEAVQALSPSDNLMKYWLVELSHNLNKLYKAMITGYNPTFAIRNVVRDLQTAGLYSRDFAAWAKNYPKALQEIAKNGEMWKQYKALGGDFSSVYDYATGTVRKPNTVVGKVADKMQALNMAMEQAPRLAEFMAVMEKGDGSMEAAMDAMLAAADVTTNFGRSGTWGKVLNAHIVPFLNPGIQGFDKMVRYATQSKNGKQFLMMATRAAALGIAPSLINALLYHDDEEWEELRDSDKDTNYMFKLKDGLWLKIPKGRELSVLGIAADRVGDALQGEEVDIRATLNTIGTQVAPANPLNENIARAWMDADLFDPSSPGRTWYGGDIEGQRLQNYAPGERYDSSTDVASKAVGGALNLSPKKLNYLADQYTGVVGDIVLPLLTPQAERDMFSKAFTVDSISSNELSGRFYDKSDELTYAKNSGDTTAAVVSRYWNHVGSEVSKLYGEIRDVENSDLSNREKKEQVQELQRQINAIQREALATVDQYTAAVGNNLFGYTDEIQDFAYRETNRDVFGAEYALKVYNKDVYAKAKTAVRDGGSYEDYYDYHFTTSDYSTAGKLNYLIESGMTTAEQSAIYYTAIATDNDEEKQQELEASVRLSREQYYQYRVATYGIKGDKGADGKTIPGSKRDKVLAQINALDLTVAQKDALYLENGYAKDDLYKNAPWYNIRPRL